MNTQKKERLQKRLRRSRWRVMKFGKATVKVTHCPACRSFDSMLTCVVCEGRGWATKKEIVAYVMGKLVSKTGELIQEMEMLRSEIHLAKERLVSLED